MTEKRKKKSDLTSCLDSVIGSFSSVNSSSNTGLDEVDGSFSTFLSIFRSTWRERNITLLKDVVIKQEWIWSYQNKFSCGEKNKK